MPGRITDDRHRPVSLYGLMTHRPRELHDRGIPIDVLIRIEHRVRRRVDPATFALHPLVLLYAAIGSVGAWFALHALTQWPLTIKTAGVAVIASYALVSMLMLPFRRLFYQPREAAPIIDAFLAEARCPACGYDLAAAEPEPDACVVCPECGAAWSLRRDSGANSG